MSRPRVAEQPNHRAPTRCRPVQGLRRDEGVTALRSVVDYQASLGTRFATGYGWTFRRPFWSGPRIIQEDISSNISGITIAATIMRRHGGGTRRDRRVQQCRHRSSCEENALSRLGRYPIDAPASARIDYLDGSAGGNRTENASRSPSSVRHRELRHVGHRVTPWNTSARHPLMLSWPPDRKEFDAGLRQRTLGLVRS